MSGRHAAHGAARRVDWTAAHRVVLGGVFAASALIGLARLAALA